MIDDADCYQGTRLFTWIFGTFDSFLLRLLVVLQFWKLFDF